MRPRQATRRRIVLGVIAAAASAGALTLAMHVRTRWSTPPMEVEQVVAELAPPLPPGARIEGRARSRVRVGPLYPGSPLSGGGRRQSLIAPAPSRVSFRLEVPRHARLRFALGVERWKRPRWRPSGVRFRVRADGKEVFHRVLNPWARPKDRRWVEGEVDLGAYAGRSVNITLETDVEGRRQPLAATPGWSHVQLVRKRSVRRQLASSSAPNVLILLVDTLRADRLGCYGAKPSPSPTLDFLAARGLLFEQAVSQSSWTIPSVASLLSGLHPRSHGALGERPSLLTPGGKPKSAVAFLADQVVTWAEEAEAAGIATFAVSANPLLTRSTNMAQGFMTFIELPQHRADKRWASAAEVNRAFLRWLQANREYRFAAYLHYMEPHDPYTPPPALRPPSPPPGMPPALAMGKVDASAKRINWHGAKPLPAAWTAYLLKLYDAEIRAWDDALADLLRGLDELGVRRSTVIVVTSDHGEEFQEHGRLKHGSHLYEESVHVPLIIAGPGIPVGRRREQVQGIDLFPTVAALLGIEVPSYLPGRNVLPGPGPERRALIETRDGISPDGKAIAVVALRTSGWKLIESPALPRIELYDLARDPGEHKDLYGKVPIGARLHEELQHFATVPPPAVSPRHNPAVTEKLRALGYVD